MLRFKPFFFLYGFRFGTKVCFFNLVSKAVQCGLTYFGLCVLVVWQFGAYRFSEYIFCSLCPFLNRNRYITIRKFYCQDKEIKKTDHFRLPSMAQKRCMILSSPIVF